MFFSNEDTIWSVLKNLISGQPQQCWMLYGRKKYIPYSEMSPEP
jgi:hypothetical protein